MIAHPAPPQKKLHLVIHGRVQGVFYRDSMRIEAQRLGVNGWVKNRSDGSVEAAVHGDSVAVDALVRSIVDVVIAASRRDAVRVVDGARQHVRGI